MIRLPVLLLAWLAALAAPAPAPDGVRRAALGFNAAAPGEARLRDPATGRHYVAFLEPWRDVRGNVVVVDLVLADPRRRDDNLLDPFRGGHGLNWHHFAALDLAGGAARSAYGGPVRHLSIRGTRSLLAVAIAVDVASVAGMDPAELGGSEIRSLSLAVSLER